MKDYSEAYGRKGAITDDTQMTLFTAESLILKTDKNNEETLRIIDKALDMVGKSILEPEAIENIGAGWMAQEALGIRIYCALVAKDDFKKGVLLSANHFLDIAWPRVESGRKAFKKIINETINHE